MAPARSLVQPTSNVEKTRRHLANFPPCIYGDRFISFRFDSSSFEAYGKEIEGMKEEVRGMLLDLTINSIDKIKLIETLHRVGVSYHFHKEIDEQLEMILDTVDFNNKHDNEEHDLHTISITFRVFRQHGYNICSDIFNKFLNSEGKFKESLASDTTAMLSLYEASQLRVQGEDVLEEAVAFTTTHLKHCATAINIDPLLEKRVTRALTQSFHRGIPRVESKVYISMYAEEEDKSSRNNSIQKLVKLVFNNLQQLHQQELCIISKWWKELGVRSKLPYCRDRVAECYLYVNAVYFEACFSSARVMLTKIELFISVLDDTYDAYGTIDELKLFTEAIDRWDIDCIDKLPDYMKFLYGALLNLYDEVREELTKDDKAFSIYYTIEATKELCRSYLHQAIWLVNGYVPTLEEYSDIAYGTSTIYVLAVAGYMGLGEFTTKEAFEWINGRPKILKAAEAIGRLSNDIAGNAVEQKRGHVASSIECYMNEFGVSQGDAILALQEIIREAWKDINEECLKPSIVPMPLLTRLLNAARYVDVVYTHVDGYTNPEVLKNCITSVFLDPLPV